MWSPNISGPTLDAYQLLTQVGELYVGNMVDTTYSLVARCPKRYLNGA
ncbi:MAG: hypothetical protein M3Q60_22460 [Actinomycetota bacterium]|nr:hypothetical protein [Actinomycetota bacterium]